LSTGTSGTWDTKTKTGTNFYISESFDYNFKIKASWNLGFRANRTGSITHGKIEPNAVARFYLNSLTKFVIGQYFAVEFQVLVAPI